ncbi:MAG TPA: DUF3300 domain-containing protein [Steroidobacteraceae bacterium]|nr:DUF3300 domain-containing protein [Steroidobacteraceae bacterium]
MPCKSMASMLTRLVWLCAMLVATAGTYGQNAAPPTPDQLDQLLAPIALYPDALVAQICAASTDPQQVLDVDNWLHQNLTLTGQARTDAAQAKGFDPAFVALINFAQVLDMMAQNIDNYAAIGRAFSADQGTVMDSIQRLRQQAYAAGTLESNEYQNVEVQGQGTTQVVVIQPANPQVIYVPQYNPQVVYVQPDPNAVVAASVISFGAGIVLGAWISSNRYPWYWGGWGWSWGHRTVIVHNNYWVVNNRYRPPYPSYRPRPPMYGPPIYARPPGNWYTRPGYRPPPGGRPPPPPPPGARPPASRPPGYTPPATRPPGNPPPQTRPPGNKPPETRPPGTSPPSGRPPGGAPPQQRPPNNATRPAPRPGTPQYRPSPDAGYSRGPSRPPSANYGNRNNAFGGGNNAAVDRAAANRGRSSVASQQTQAGGAKRR